LWQGVNLKTCKEKLERNTFKFYLVSHICVDTGSAVSLFSEIDGLIRFAASIDDEEVFTTTLSFAAVECI